MTVQHPENELRYNKMPTVQLTKTVNFGKWLPHVLKKEQVVHVHVS